ncbi:hypothetical protein [Streptosporangium longisporum]|uniref:Uncharacterized protein n=1 Tax=Streptosporangium longisporum TaxID=46187 RepID=A0ABP6KQR7_9ACTN
MSDPVGLATTTETDLVISTYHATPCGPATYHPFALQTGYVAAGDVVSRTTLSGAQEVEPRFHLTGVDVRTSPGRRVVAALTEVSSMLPGSRPGQRSRP